MFLFIYDESKKRVIHFASDEDFDFLEIFNQKLEREFLTNDDYQRVGGQDDDNDFDMSVHGNNSSILEQHSTTKPGSMNNP